MNKNTIILYTTTSLFIISNTATAREIDVTCEQLGYTVPVSECLEQGSMPLVCPVAQGETDEERMSLCYSESCRGHPLWKKDGYYYHLDKNGNPIKIAAVGSLGYIKGGEAALLSCKTGLTENAMTYYKVKECEDGAIINNDICVNGCGRESYPYDKHPGDLAGAVASCEDAEGEHFGYTSCNDGWDLKDGQCLLSSCDIKTYPYIGDPNLLNDEYRGVTTTCRIGGNAYYKYDSCDTTKLDSNNNPIYILKKGICIKKCALKPENCTKTSKTVDGFTYNDWSCELDSTCRVGDYVTYNGTDIGIIFHLKKDENDKTLVAGLATTNKKWAHGVYETTDINTITNITGTAAAKADYAGKIKTQKIIGFTTDYTTNYPAAAYCYNHNVSACASGSVCAKGEWYLPAEGELGYMFDNRYIMYNVTNSTTFYNSYFWSSTEYYAGNAWGLYFSTGDRGSPTKSNSYSVRPVLAF